MDPRSKRPVTKDGVIIEGGWGKPLDYYSEEAKQQRIEQWKEKLDKLLDEYPGD